MAFSVENVNNDTIMCLKNDLYEGVWEGNGLYYYVDHSNRVYHFDHNGYLREYQKDDIPNIHFVRSRQKITLYNPEYV